MIKKQVYSRDVCLPFERVNMIRGKVMLEAGLFERESAHDSYRAEMYLRQALLLGCKAAKFELERGYLLGVFGRKTTVIV